MLPSGARYDYEAVVVPRVNGNSLSGDTGTIISSYILMHRWRVNVTVSTAQTVPPGKTEMITNGNGIDGMFEPGEATLCSRQHPGSILQYNCWK